ncbi:DUF4440 domain-containing protein [Streptomyces sp. NPDC057690]|uniref:DUF4440 domain-containing protein n=1 Tax=Streptomyces sp. NPDC057690 TaxID=3346214 RepID=UPI003699B979
MLIGITGDLAKKMLLPALCHLVGQGLLTVPVIGVTRGGWTLDRPRRHARECVQAQGPLDEKAFARLAGLLRLAVVDYDEPDSFRSMSEEARGSKSLAHYPAVPPGLHARAAGVLAGAGLNDSARLVVEEPFGHDLASARALQVELTRHFPEERLRRVDHFLGRDIVEDLLTVRFANPLMQAVLDRRNVRSVQITMTEDFDVSDRGGFYDAAGCLRDVVQNELERPVDHYAAGRAGSTASGFVRFRLMPRSGVTLGLLAQHAGDATVLDKISAVADFTRLTGNDTTAYEHILAESVSGAPRRPCQYGHDRRVLACRRRRARLRKPAGRLRPRQLGPRTGHRRPMVPVGERGVQPVRGPGRHPRQHHPAGDRRQDRVQVLEPALKSSSADQNAREEIFRMQRAYLDAMHEGDTEALDALLDDGFTLTHMTGYVQPKVEWLAQMEQDRFVYHTIDEKSMTLDVLVDTAHLVVRTVTDATVYGTRADWRLQLATEYARRGDAWVVLRTEATTW